MGYEARILADSISPEGCRLTTILVRLPRIVLAEFNTHRMFSRNSASSRAIPVATQLRRLMDDPFVPGEFGANQPGMQAGDPLIGMKHDAAVEEWLCQRDEAVLGALRLMSSPKFVNAGLGLGMTVADLVAEVSEKVRLKNPELYDMPDFLGVHKGLASRPLEAFMWHEVIVTASSWGNFRALRTDENAQLEIRIAAHLMMDAYDQSQPVAVGYGEWHLPLIQPDETDWARAHPDQAVKVSASRCAAVSYRSHETDRVDIDADLRRYDRLVGPGHMSPLEHPATPFTPDEWVVRYAMAGVAEKTGAENGLSDLQIGQLVAMVQYLGNFEGWTQHRKQVPHEDDFGQILAAV